MANIHRKLPSIRKLSGREVEVYVEQRGPKYEVENVFLFWFKTLSLTENDCFVLSERWDDQPEDSNFQSWGADKKEGPTLTMDYCNRAALMFSNVNNAERLRYYS